MDSTPPIIHIHLTHYTLAISQYVMSMCVKKKYIKMIIFCICPYDWFVNITLHQWLEITTSNKTSLVISFSPTSLLKTLMGGSKKFRVCWKGGSKKLRVSHVGRGGQKSFGYSERGGQKSFDIPKLKFSSPPTKVFMNGPLLNVNI